MKKAGNRKGKGLLGTNTGNIMIWCKVHYLSPELVKIELMRSDDIYLMRDGIGGLWKISGKICEENFIGIRICIVLYIEIFNELYVESVGEAEENLSSGGKGIFSMNFTLDVKFVGEAGGKSG